MKKNLFEIGRDFEDSWTSDNKTKPQTKPTTEIKEPSKHKLHLAKEKRRGKVVTIAKPFQLEKSTKQELLKQLKKKLGTGGTIKEHSLEFQGDIQETLRKYLVEFGYGFK